MHNQAAIREVKMRNTLPNGNSRNIHPAKRRDYTVEANTRDVLVTGRDFGICPVIGICFLHKATIDTVLFGSVVPIAI